MKVDTFGNPDNPAILLIHSIFYPGITSYRSILPLIEKDYYVIIPNLDGLNFPHSEFISTRRQADQIIDWLKKNDIFHIHFILGSSYGSSVAFEILKDQSLKIDKAALDSPALKCSKIYGMMLYHEMKKMVKTFKKKGVNAFHSYDKYKYISKDDEEYCLKVYNDMDKKTIKNLAYSCYDYVLPSELYREGTTIRFLFWEKDKSKINLPEIKELKAGEIRILEGMSHMQYIFENPVDFLHECDLEIRNEKQNCV